MPVFASTFSFPSPVSPNATAFTISCSAGGDSVAIFFPDGSYNGRHYLCPVTASDPLSTWIAQGSYQIAEYDSATTTTNMDTTITTLSTLQADPGYKSVDPLVIAPPNNLCPDLTDFTCYMGDFNNPLKVIVSAMSVGLLGGLVVGILRNQLFKRI